MRERRPKGKQSFLLDPDGDGWTAVLGAAATSITIDGLSQYDALEFDLTAVLNGASLPAFIYGRPNASSSNLVSIALSALSSGSVTAAATAADARLVASGDALRTEFHIHGEFGLKPGRNRLMEARGVCLRSDGVAERVEVSGGILKDTSAIISSFQFVASTALGLNTGTRLAAWGIKW